MNQDNEWFLIERLVRVLESIDQIVGFSGKAKSVLIDAKKYLDAEREG